MVAAVGEWNKFSSSTHIQIDFAPPGAIPDIQVIPSSDANNTGSCASFRPSLGRLYYAPDFPTVAGDPNVGRLILSHELGHALGLGDGGTSPSPPSIMNNPINGPDSDFCTNPIVYTSTVQQNDADATVGCRQKGMNEYARILRMTSTTVQPGIDLAHFTGPLLPQSDNSCVYEYQPIYVYVDGEYDSMEWDLVSVIC